MRELKANRRRWRPRFSLLTLLLVVLLWGSGLLLWRNQAPWAVLQTIEFPDAVREAKFSRRGTYFLLQRGPKGRTARQKIPKLRPSESMNQQPGDCA